MQLFYSTLVQDQIIFLEDQEARHCTQVLRKQIGDQISVTDGQGNLYHTELHKASKNQCELLIQETIPSPPHLPYLHMAIVPTKNIDRVEWFIEKATELGINEISLILADHSERKKIRYDRLEKLLIAAMKQSLNLHLPKLNDLTPFSDWINAYSTENTTLKFIPHCYDGAKSTLKAVYQPGQDALVLIGPEGDFSKVEVDLAESKGFQAISLGQTRLRTETAAISVCAFINWMNL